MKRILPIVASLALVLGCANGNSDSAKSASPSQSSSSSAPTSVVNSEAKLYFVSDTGTSFRLYSEIHQVKISSDQDLVNALSALISGEKPIDPDYVNLWQSDSSLNSISIDDDLATIDLHLGTLNVGAESEMRAIEQILFTIAAIDKTIKQVRFLNDGKDVETFAGHVDVTRPFQIDEGYSSLATVDLDIEDGSTLAKPYVVTGLACTFEANVPWELEQNGIGVGSGAVTAQLACPDRSKFEIDLGDLQPGTYVLHIWESSMENGSLINEDSKTLIIR